MKRLFIETEEFRRRWAVLGMSDDDLRELQSYLLEQPEAGNMIPGAGGVRKLRWARAGRGKSGGVRTIYLDIRNRSTIWLITAFGKNEQVDLAPAERQEIKEFVKRLLKE